MPKGKDYDKKFDDAKHMLYAYEKKNDWNGMAAYMKQLYIQSFFTGEEVDPDNTPYYDAMKTYIAETCDEAAEGQEGIDKLRAIAFAANEQSAETVYQASERLEEIEEQIRNGEIEDTEFWADDPKRTERLAGAILSTKTEWGKEMDAARGVGQLLETGLSEWEQAVHGSSKTINNTYKSLFEDTSENQKLVERSETYRAAEKYLMSKTGMTKEKQLKLAKYAVSQPEFSANSYTISRDDPKVIFDIIPEPKAESKILSDDELEERKQGYIRGAAETDSEFIRDNMKQFAMECGYEQEKRAMLKADPIGMKTVSLAQKKIDVLTAEQDMIDIYRRTVNDMTAMTKASVNFFAEDKSKRIELLRSKQKKSPAADTNKAPELDPVKHKDYLKLTEMAEEISKINGNTTPPEEVIRKLREAKEAAEQYFKSHTVGGLFMLKLSEDGRQRVRNASRIKLAIDENIERLEKFAYGVAENLATDQTVADRYSEVKNDKAQLRAGNNMRKKEIRDKAREQLKAELAAKEEAARIKQEAAEAEPEIKDILVGDSGAFEIDLDSFGSPETAVRENAETAPEVKGFTGGDTGAFEIDLDTFEVPENAETEEEPEITARARSNGFYKKSSQAKADMEASEKTVMPENVQASRADIAPETKAKAYSVSAAQDSIKEIMAEASEITPEVKAKVATHMANIIAVSTVAKEQKDITSQEAQAKIDQTAAVVVGSRAFKNMLDKANTPKSFNKLVNKATAKNPSELLVEYSKEYVKQKNEAPRRTASTVTPKKNRALGE